MMKVMSLLFVLSALTVYHPDAEAQRGGSSGGGRSGGSSGGGSSGGGRSSGGGSSGGSSSSGRSSGGSSSSGRSSGGSSSSSSRPSGGSSSSSSRPSGGYSGGSSSSSSGRSAGGSASSGRTSGGVSSGGSSSSGRSGGSVDQNRYSRSQVAAPGVGRNTTVSGYSQGSGRRARDVVDYQRGGRTVLRETYSNNRNSLSRTFYNREGSARGFYDNYQYNRAYNYNRVLYRNTYVYVYQPLYVYDGHSYWYGQFCSHNYYYSHYYSNPWRYNWWWHNDPWYGYYGYYYRPYATYVYPSQWLVDYYWASLLADDYQDQVDAGTISSQQSTIASQQSTIAAQQAEIDGLKAQLEKQINEEMTARKSGSTVALDQKLLDKARVYVMSSNLNFVTADAAAITCSLSSGDVISLADEGVGADGKTATMLVRSSKQGNCKAGSKILVSVETLQEFENEFNRRLDLGTEKMEEDNTTSSILSDQEGQF